MSMPFALCFWWDKGALCVLFFCQNGLSQKKSHLLTMLMVICLSVVSAIVYAVQGYFCLDKTVFVLLGAVVGVLAGTKLFKKITNNWLRGCFFVTLLVAGVVSLVW